MTTPAAISAWLRAGEALGAAHRLRVPRDAMRGLSGRRLGSHAGASVDFMDYRDYQPGDDPRGVDWHVFARSDRLMMKLYRAEVNPHLDILLDCSASMALPEAKTQRAVETAALLAAAALNAGCTWQCWRMAGGMVRHGAASQRAAQWPELAFGGASGLGLARGGAAPLRRAGLRIVISDLWWDEPPEACVQTLAQGAAMLTVLHVLADEERAPALHGPVRLRDSESGDELELTVDAQTVETYVHGLARHCAAWEHACRRAQARFVALDGAAPLASALFHAGILE